MNVRVVDGEGSWLQLTDGARATYCPQLLVWLGHHLLVVTSCSTRPRISRLWLLCLFLPFPLMPSLPLLPSFVSRFGPPDLSHTPSAVCSPGPVSCMSVGHQLKGHESNRRGCLPAVSSNVWSLADGSSSYRGNPANLL